MRRDRNPRDPRKWPWRPSLGRLTVTRGSVSRNWSRSCCNRRPARCPQARRSRVDSAEGIGDEHEQTGDAMTTSSGSRHTTLTAFLVGARSLWQHPRLAVGFLLATLAQGALQGCMVWALRQVLIMLNGPGGVNRRLLLVGALAVCTVWFVRAAAIYAAQALAGRLASRVELRWMRWVLEKLLTLPVGFFDRSSRGDLVMTAYNDTKTVRLVTVQFGQLVLYLSQLAGLMVAAWAMSAKLALIGLGVAPLACVPVYWL